MNREMLEFQINRNCGANIRLRYSETDQRNILADALLSIEGSKPQLAHMRAWIDAHRSHAKLLRERLAATPDEELHTFDPQEGWPQEVGIEQQTAAEAMLDELETVKAKLDERPDFKFKVNFLQTERLVDENLSDADKRLFEEYSDLELRRPLEAADDARWRLLQAGLFDFKG